MPAYGSQVYIDFNHTNQPLWQGEQPAPGNGGASACAPVKFPPETSSFYVQGFFTAAPGVFEIDVQSAPEDVDAEYETLPGGVINVADPINFGFRFDAVLLKVRFVRALMRARGNAVGVFLRIGR